jgi:hypothetical protein
VTLAPSIAGAIRGNRPLRRQESRAPITSFPFPVWLPGFQALPKLLLPTVALHVTLDHLLLTDEAGDQEVEGPHLPAPFTVRPSDHRLEDVAGIKHFFPISSLERGLTAAVREIFCDLLPPYEPEIGADGGWFRSEPARFARPSWSGAHWFLLPGAGS